ncbi:MAG: phenylpyruvate tautomerase PptA (4-oxalocrotonate tautomerase family) [Candidatus Marinamargulisbacteria bacterium]|jgi:phenylpyruvate tautomerase PptA (4-oxalocrotonate tautomerase family)
MPVIQFQSLLFEEPVDMASILASITDKLSETLAINRDHFTLFWTYIQAHHYTVGGESKKFQPRDSHPIMIDVLVPDFHDTDMCKAMLCTLSSALSEETDIPEDNLFINLRFAHSNRVFDQGEVVTWH